MVINSRPPPEVFGNAAIGIDRALLPPVAAMEPEALGYVSGRSWVTAAPTPLSAYSRAERSYVPVGALDGPSVPQYSFGCDIDTSSFAPSEHEVRSLYDTTTGILDLQREVFSSTKGVIRETRVVGLRCVRSQERIRIGETNDPHGQGRVVLEPGYAAAFSIAVDEGVIKTRRVLNNAFPDPTNNLADVTRVCRHGRSLLTTHVDTSRYVMRLASMYVESAMATGGRAAFVHWDSAALPPYQPLGTWATWRPAAVADMGMNAEMNYIPWARASGVNMPQEVTYFRVLRLAAAADVTFTLRGAATRPMCWPVIDNPIVVSTAPIGLLEQEAPDLDLLPSDIYAAARMWAHRYSSQQLFEDYVKYLMMMYWADAEFPVERRLAVSFPMPMLEMPRAQMRAFLLLPFIAGMDDAHSLISSIGFMSHNMRLAETVMAAMVTGAASCWAGWLELDYAWGSGLVSAREQTQLLTKLRAFAGPSVVWDKAQKWATALGYEGSFGRLITETSTAATTTSYNRHVTNGHMVRNTGDCLGWLPFLPAGSAAHAWQHPKPLDRNRFYADQATMNSVLNEHGGLHAQATIAEQNEVEWFIQLYDQRQGSLTTSLLGQLPRTRSGFIYDMPTVDYACSSGQWYRFGFRLGTKAWHALTDAQNDRFRVKWWWRPTTTSVLRTVPHVNGDPPNDPMGSAFTPFGQNNCRWGVDQTHPAPRHHSRTGQLTREAFTEPGGVGNEFSAPSRQRELLSTSELQQDAKQTPDASTASAPRAHDYIQPADVQLHMEDTPTAGYRLNAANKPMSPATSCPPSSESDVCGVGEKGEHGHRLQQDQGPVSHSATLDAATVKISDGSSSPGRDKDVEVYYSNAVPDERQQKEETRNEVHAAAGLPQEAVPNTEAPETGFSTNRAILGEWRVTEEPWDAEFDCEIEAAGTTISQSDGANDDDQNTETDNHAAPRAVTTRSGELSHSVSPDSVTVTEGTSQSKPRSPGDPKTLPMRQQFQLLKSGTRLCYDELRRSPRATDVQLAAAVRAAIRPPPAAAAYVAHAEYAAEVIERARDQFERMAPVPTKQRTAPARGSGVVPMVTAETLNRLVRPQASLFRAQDPSKHQPATGGLRTLGIERVFPVSDNVLGFAAATTHNDHLQLGGRVRQQVEFVDDTANSAIGDAKVNRSASNRERVNMDLYRDSRPQQRMDCIKQVNAVNPEQPGPDSRSGKQNLATATTALPVLVAEPMIETKDDQASEALQ